MLVVGRPRVDGDDPPEVGRIPLPQLLHLRLGHLTNPAEALGELPGDQHLFPCGELLLAPGRRVEEDQVEAALAVGSADLEHGLAAAHALGADGAHRHHGDGRLPGAQLGHPPHRGAVLPGPRQELERRLDGRPPPLLEQRARSRVGTGDGGERGGEPPTPLRPVLPGRRAGPAAGSPRPEASWPGRAAVPPVRAAPAPVASPGSGRAAPGPRGRPGGARASPGRRRCGRGRRAAVRAGARRGRRRPPPAGRARARAWHPPSGHGPPRRARCPPARPGGPGPPPPAGPRSGAARRAP